MLSRRTSLTALAVLAGLTLSPVAAAHAAPPADRDRGGSVSKQHPTKPKLVQVGGTVTAVDAAAGTVVLRAHGKGRPTVTLTVAEGARVQKDGVAATLADLAVGDHVSAKASRAGDLLTAVRVNASSPEADGDSD